VDALTVYGAAPDLLERLSPEAAEVLTALAQVTDELKNEITGAGFLVGGTVRDLLLGRSSRDLDVVLETPAKPPATALQARLGGKLACHEDFLTCTLEWPTLTLDLATARHDYYSHPGALPVVQASTLDRDLYRRDFSVNTFALRLQEPHTLVSVAGAKADLGTRTLRVLHRRSFFDDPTRIVRGSRLAGRLGFGYAAATRQGLADALAAGAHEHVSPARLKSELLLTLAEPTVAPALDHLADSDAFVALYGLHVTPLITSLDALQDNVTVSPTSYLLALLLALGDAAAAAHVRRFSWPEKLLKARARLLAGERPRTDAERVVYRVLGPDGAADLQLRGSDVLNLGLSAGPEVGRVLRRVKEARRDGQVASFAAELELAKRLVHDIRTRGNT